MTTITAPSAAPSPALRDGLDLVVDRIRDLTPVVREVTFRSADGAELPGFTAGSHLVVECAGERGTRTNGYSLTGEGLFPTRYTIAVRRDDAGHGGSLFVHGLRSGDRVRTSRPRSAFAPIVSARRHLLIGAGIGITPIVSHARAAARTGTPALILYRHRPGEASHLRELRGLASAHRHLELRAVGSRADWDTVFADALRSQPLGTHLYACGPNGFTDAVRESAIAAGWPDGRLHFEAFGAQTEPGEPFVLRLGRSGEELPVSAGDSGLEVLEASGRTVPNMCRQGVCGECMLSVLSGTPDHKDLFLSPEEKESGRYVMCCVSRATGPTLEVDL
ncbi:PDR/VanB family oxidoreductase [Brevibacterium samyangense]|uniref:PDR/VanB family oxidoreductase n=1 Tax=Brevibacterium samyangense TaxID=366888 RepID=A0ABN2TIK6_9MICO